MSVNFILEYAGGPVRFADDSGAIEIVPEHLATPFSSDGDALMRARNAGLNLDRCEAVNTYLRDKEAGHAGRPALQ
jgi:hypothetical protein